jgi:hypothetical protein
VALFGPTPPPISEAALPTFRRVSATHKWSRARVAITVRRKRSKLCLGCTSRYEYLDYKQNEGPQNVIRCALRGNRTPGGSMATTQVTTTPLMRCQMLLRLQFHAKRMDGFAVNARYLLSARTVTPDPPTWIRRTARRIMRYLHRSLLSSARSRSRSRHSRPRCVVLLKNALSLALMKRTPS